MDRVFLHVLVLTATSLALSGATPAIAQDTSAGQPAAAETPPLSQEELDQMLAPIALYPDSLVSQILMASTYPLEVVEADRWAKANASLKGDALATALEEQSWDPSVKSLVNFPDVLAMMSEKLTITTKLGDAFLTQQEQVMNSIQSLRAKAKAAGNLESNQEQVIKVEPAAGGSQTQTIIIEPASPQVVYVPQYNPTVVYGTWPYPAYPPYPYYPPGYVASNVISFGVGVAVGAAWGYAWGGCNWGRGNVDIDINRNINVNNRINRSNYNRGGAGNGAWRHDSSHRHGAPYRDSRTANQYGGRSSSQVAQQREAYRGRGNQTGAGTNRSTGGRSATGDRGGARPSTNDRSGARPSTGDRSSTGARPSTRESPSTNRSGGSALSGAGSSGRSTRDASSRGSSSRSGSASRGSSGSRSSGSRSSGSRGGSRGGGGRGR